MIDRRKFCKLTGLAAAFAAVSKASAATTGLDGERCRITVLRRECYADLQAMYLDEPESGACRHVEVGQQFTAVAGGRCPEGMCPRAWKSLQPEVERLLSGDKECGVCGGKGCRAIVCCGDGTRPVIFSVEVC